MGIAISPNGSYLYATNGSVNAFSVGPGGTLTSINSYSSSAPSQQGVAISPNGSYLYVADYGSYVLTGTTVSAFTIGSRRHARVGRRLHIRSLLE